MENDKKIEENLNNVIDSSNISLHGEINMTSTCI